MGYTGRVCDRAAQHVVEVMRAARAAHRHERAGAAGGSGAHSTARPPSTQPPKAVVFSEFQNDLEQVSSGLGLTPTPTLTLTLNPNPYPTPTPKPNPKPTPHQVTSRLVHRLGTEAVAQHWGDFRSTELARFRNGRAS